MSALVLSSGCAASAPSPRAASDVPVVAVEAIPRGLLRTDASGHWTPALAARARLTSDGPVDLLAAAAASDGTVLAVRHPGPLRLEGQEVVASAGLSIVRLGADATFRWAHRFEGAQLDVSSVAMDRTGAVLVVGTGAGKMRLGAVTFCELGDTPTSFLAVLEADGARGSSMKLLPARQATIVVAAHRGSGRIGYVARPGARSESGDRLVLHSVGPDGGSYQIMESDQPIEARGADASFEGWTVVVGRFSGTLAAGGRPAIGTEWPGPFVTAIDDDARIGWLVPVAVPDEATSLDPLAVRVDADGAVHLGMVAGNRDGSGSLHLATLDGAGVATSSCEMMRGPADLEVEAIELADDLVVARGSLDGATLRFFAPSCSPAAQLVAPPGERVVAAVPTGARVVLAVAVDGAAEVRVFER